MILVILGTQDKSFCRLLQEVDKIIEKGLIQDKVIVQAGSTKYQSEHMEIFDLISMKKFNTLISQADLIITHGGVGSIMQGLKKNKKIIAVPRLAKYGEHTNDHQKQIISKFVESGYILGCNNVEELEEKLHESKNFQPKRYKNNNSMMLTIIEEFIENEG